MSGEKIVDDPMLGQVEQLGAANATPPAGINRKSPRCITPRCPSKAKCKGPEYEGNPRDYTVNLGDSDFCGYFRPKTGIWMPTNI